MAESKSK